MWDSIILTWPVVTVALFLLADHVFKISHYWFLGRKFPGPPAVPLLGNIFDISRDPQETFEMVCNSCDTYGSVVRFMIGPTLMFVLTDPEDAKLFLKHPKVVNRSSVLCMAARPILGKGLLTNRDAIWRLHHKLVTPAFQYKILESYVQVFWKKAQILADVVEEFADGRTVDIHGYIGACTLDAICETAIGINMNVQYEGNDIIKKAHTLQGIVHDRIARPWLLFDWLYPLTSDGKEMAAMTKYFEDLGEDIISSKLLARKKSKGSQESVPTVVKKNISFLDLILEQSDLEGINFSQEDLRDEVRSLYLAGMETSAGTLAYTLILLGMHADYQERVYQEMQEVLGETDREITPEALPKLRYTECVFKETMRLFPKVPFLSRDVPVDVPLTNGNVLPAGCSAIVFLYAMHRDAKNFTQPDQFWPDRWLPENLEDRHPFSYLPFSAGPRSCVGQKYAMMNLKIMLISLLKRYRIGCDCYTMKDLEKIKMAISIGSAVGYNIQLYKR